ncbi:MAG TPA: hypothetical protein VN845_14570 [Solirubrobacteraceae bacterium]|nr:hypothetical protein [Solirubrobacteraceae bacterium]
MAQLGKRKGMAHDVREIAAHNQAVLSRLQAFAHVGNGHRAKPALTSGHGQQVTQQLAWVRYVFPHVLRFEFVRHSQREGVLDEAAEVGL